jgi:RNA polymerase sigma factor (sigma-70 family)
MGARGRDEEEFRRLYESCYRHICAYARRRVDEADADDAVAETFLVAWRRLEAIPQGDLALAWLYGVARRVLSQQHRGGRRRDRLIARLGGFRQDVSNGTVDLDRVDEQHLVRSALVTLRESDQEILRLSEWEELSAAQMAVALGCSTNAVAIRLHRAHRRLGTVLAVMDAKAGASEKEESQ